MNTFQVWMPKISFLDIRGSPKSVKNLMSLIKYISEKDGALK